MSWAKRYLQMSFKPYGCGEFAEKVLKEQFHVEHNFPKTSGDLRKDPFIIKGACESFLKKTDAPQDGDVVLMGGDRESCHVGIFVIENEKEYVLHTDRKMRVSVLTEIKNLILIGYFLEGYYTWRK